MLLLKCEKKCIKGAGQTNRFFYIRVNMTTDPLITSSFWEEYPGLEVLIYLVYV